ncbi:MAG TPA: pitrilysin family protein [Dissulfurispiraceae bacterium]|nr:pitrilysin family protein [Dissulfurispiraceae bacterium]
MNRQLKFYAFALLFMFALAFLPAATDAFEMHKEKLANGLTVVYVERREVPIVMATLLVKASPLQESSAKSGTAYIAAKMLSEGTATRKATDISREIDFLGAALDTSVNHDYTTLSLSVLKKDVNKGFDLFSDVALHPTFPSDEFARKKEQIKGALKQREEDPSYVAGREFSRDVFGNYPYGRPVEGSIQSIDGIGRDDVLNFYSSLYRPDNAILTVVGDIGRDELNSLLSRTFSSWNNQADTVEQKTQPGTPQPLKGARVDIIDRDVAQANILFGYVGIARNDPDYYAVQVMNYIFGGGGFSSRLMKVIRDEMGLTYSINSFFAATKFPGRFEIEVQTKNESAGIVVGEILKQLRLMKEGPVSEQELRDAKDYLIGSFPRRLETSRKTADFLAAMLYYGLGDDYIDRYKTYISGVSREDVLQVARKYLDDKNYVLVVVGNKKKLKL